MYSKDIHKRDKNLGSSSWHLNSLYVYSYVVDSASATTEQVISLYFLRRPIYLGL